MKVFNFRFAKLGIAMSWVAAVGGAQAGSYEGGYYDTGYTAASQNSTVVTEGKVLITASEAQIGMVSSQISHRLDAHTPAAGNSFSLLPQAGGNAGATDQRGSIWARAGIDHMKEDSITRLGGWNANLWSLAIGYDYKFNDKVLAGLALTYSNLNGSTKFNNGSMRDNAYGLVPYVAFRVSPCFDVDVMAGYSRVNKKRDRGTPSSNTDNALSGTKATSSPKSDRYFAALFGNLKQRVNHWNLLARLGYMYATDRQKSYTETNGDLLNLNTGRRSNRSVAGLTNSVNRVSLRLQAGYQVSKTVEPYAFLTYARDFGVTKMKVPDTVVTSIGTDSTYVSPNKRRSNNTFGGGLGLNANTGGGWTSGIEANYLKSKKFQNIGGMIRVSKKF